MSTTSVAPYELWDLETGNCLGAYQDEAMALTEVREGVRKDGRAAWMSVGLLRRGDDTSETAAIAEGDDLIALAREAREPAAPAAR
jgi:hypothetical protein